MTPETANITKTGITVNCIPSAVYANLEVTQRQAQRDVEFILISLLCVKRYKKH